MGACVIPSGMSMGSEIKRLREIRGWSQSELAKHSKVNQPTLQRIEAGTRTDPSVSIVVRIAQALGTNVESLIAKKHDGVSLLEGFGECEATPPGSAVGEKGLRSTATDAENLAAGGIILTDQLRELRDRVDQIEAWRHSLEAPSKKAVGR